MNLEIRLGNRIQLHWCSTHLSQPALQMLEIRLVELPSPGLVTVQASLTCFRAELSRRLFALFPRLEESGQVGLINRIMELLNISFNERFKLVDIETCGEDTIKISDKVVINFNHDQDCCEHVYADLNYLKNSLQNPPLANKDSFEFDNLVIKSVKEEGVVFFFSGNLCNGISNLYNRIGFFIPCYNEQNGYYSNDLHLSVTYEGIEHSIELQEKESVNNNLGW